MTMKEDILRARLVLVREAAERARALDTTDAGTKGASRGQVGRGGDALQSNMAKRKT